VELLSRSSSILSRLPVCSELSTAHLVRTFGANVVRAGGASEGAETAAEEGGGGAAAEAAEAVEGGGERGQFTLRLGEAAKSTDPATGDIITTLGRRVAASEPAARTFWCTGYSPNSRMLSDPRTAPEVAAALDDNGFVKCLPTMQLDGGVGCDRIFAGGDICAASSHCGDGERMAITASTHAWAICRNVERLCGAVATAHDYAAPAAEGAEALANAAVNAAAAPGGVGLVRCNIPAAVSSMCLSLGKQSALYSTVPTAAAYFATAAALTETLGGPPSEEKPWAEMIDNCWLKFNYCVDLYTVTLCGGSDAWWRAHDEEFLAEVGAAAAGSDGAKTDAAKTDAAKSDEGRPAAILS
jgi:hypothetical protein